MQAIQREEEMFTERKKEMTAEHEQVGAVEREDATHHQEVPNAIKRTMSTITPMPLHDVRNMQRCASEAADVTMPPMTVNAIDALARHIELPIVCKRHDMAVKALEMGRELMAKLCTPVRDGVSKSIAALEGTTRVLVCHCIDATCTLICSQSHSEPCHT